MRRLTLCLATAAAGAAAAASRPVTPYQVVLKAVEQDGRGLLAAAEVFKQFQRYYHRYQQEELQRATSSSALPKVGNSVDAAAHASRLPRGKPLTQFCGRVEDVEPMTMLLLKVLCDLQKLEEMRFLFTQCLLELDQQTPSVELFNVYLLAISMTDTFNQYEVENLVELQRAKMIVPDIVTKLSMFLLYLRLGDDACAAWWPSMREEVTEILDANATTTYPLLPLRLQHCFQTLLRLHYDPAIIHDCFKLLHRAAPERVTPATVLPYVLLSALNVAVAPPAVVEVLTAIENKSASATLTAASPASDRPQETSSTGAATSSSPSSSPSSATTEIPLLSSEITVFRLLSKCAKYGDADAASYLRRYLGKYQHVSIIAPENEPAASLLYVEACVKAGRVRTALRVLETEVPSPYHIPGERPKFFLQSRRLSLLTTDPVQNVVLALVSLMAALHVEDPVRTLITAKNEETASDEHDSNTERFPVPVTRITLDLCVAACAYMDQSSAAARRAEAVLKLYPRYKAIPTKDTYRLLLSVYASTAPQDGVPRLSTLQREMQEQGLEVDASWLSAAMTVALNARAVGAALFLLDLHARLKTSVDAKHSIRLLREVAASGDVSGMQKVLRLLRRSRSTVDPRSLALCTAVVKNLGLSAEVLDDDGATS